MSTRERQVSRRMLTYIAGKIMEMSVDGETPDEREIEDMAKLFRDTGVIPCRSSRLTIKEEQDDSATAWLTNTL